MIDLFTLPAMFHHQQWVLQNLIQLDAVSLCQRMRRRGDEHNLILMNAVNQQPAVFDWCSENNSKSKLRALNTARSSSP